MGRHSKLLVLAVAAIFVWADTSIALSQSSRAGPRFRADGKDADAFGRKEGYPACQRFTYITEQRCRVGAFSQHYNLFGPQNKSRNITAPKSPSRLTRAADEPSIRYSFAGQTLTLDQYLDLNPITGLLIAKNDAILLERYQYGRKDTHRFTSHSMAKTIIGMLIGIAVKEGSIQSIEQPAEAYVPGLKDTEYGRTPIKALLQMSSGVAFREVYRPDDDLRKLAIGIFGQPPIDTITALKQFNTRARPPGQQFYYASSESLILGHILTGATRRPVSEYAQERLWQPLGAEADAKWLLDAGGKEITFGYFNAVLRDWARLGLMLAHDGTWNGKSIVPKEWVLAATSVATGEQHLRVVDNENQLGYGYQTWLLPGGRRAFAFNGSFGQWVFVDPAAKLVMVQTAAYATNVISNREVLALWNAVVDQLK